MPQGLNDLLTLANTLDTLLGVPILIFLGYQATSWFRRHWKS